MIYIASHLTISKAPGIIAHRLVNQRLIGKAFQTPAEWSGTSRVQLSGSCGNPVFRHLIVVNGKMLGTWDRTLKVKTVSVTSSPFAPLPKAANAALGKTMKAYAKFLGLPLDVAVPR